MNLTKEAIVKILESPSLLRNPKTSQDVHLCLGMLIDRSLRYRPSSHDDGGVMQVFGSDIASITIPERKLADIQNELARSANKQTRPSAELVWALSKCTEVECACSLVGILYRSVASCDEAVLDNALSGLISFSGDSTIQTQIRYSIEYLASNYIGEARNNALRFLGRTGSNRG